MYFLYSMMLAGALALLAPWFFLRGWRHNKYLHSLVERFGSVPDRARQRQAGAVWVHAVSVGETMAVEPLVEELRRRFPQRKVLVSTTTRTGQELARLRFGEDAVFYFPLDFAFACRRVLAAIQPSLVVIAETEIWPNFLREAHRAGASVVFVNGRLSDRSFKGYRRLRALLRPVLAQVDLFLMQSEEDARRMRELGAPSERVQVGGNLKFDLPPPSPSKFLSELERVAQGAPIVVAGSTLAGEEKQVLDAMRTAEGVKGKRAVLVLAPRHPERFDEVARLLETRRVKFLRRNQLSQADSRPEVVLLDTLGELAGIYAAATVAFVGGSLVKGGGHNPIEPALWGKPVLFGPSMENFRVIAENLLEAGAAFRVNSSEAFGVLLATLLSDREACKRAGAAGRAVVEKERGATLRCAEKVAALLSSPQPAPQASPQEVTR
jgi:3-deoxy-D-manno-octulosonic-acid transferase